MVTKVVPGLGVAEEPDFGTCVCEFGVLSQNDSELEENLDILLKVLGSHPAGKKTGFITRVSLLLEDGPAYASFSIRHPSITDKKLAYHLREAAAQKS